LGLRPSTNTIYEICGSWTEAKEIAGVSDYGDKSPEQEANEFFSKLENAKPVNQKTQSETQPDYFRYVARAKGPI